VGGWGGGFLADHGGSQRLGVSAVRLSATGSDITPFTTPIAKTAWGDSCRILWASFISGRLGPPQTDSNAARAGLDAVRDAAAADAATRRKLKEERQQWLKQNGVADLAIARLKDELLKYVRLKLTESN
jgi:hypothetical protein